MVGAKLQPRVGIFFSHHTSCFRNVRRIGKIHFPKIYSFCAYLSHK